MECNKETFGLFTKYKCGMVMMNGKEEQVYDTPHGDFLFFYPSRNLMTRNKVIGRDTELNMPIIQTSTNEYEWLNVNSNDALEKILNWLVSSNT